MKNLFKLMLLAATLSTSQLSCAAVGDFDDPNLEHGPCAQEQLMRTQLNEEGWEFFDMDEKDTGLKTKAREGELDAQLQLVYTLSAAAGNDEESLSQAIHWCQKVLANAAAPEKLKVDFETRLADLLELKPGKSDSSVNFYDQFRYVKG